MQLIKFNGISIVVNPSYAVRNFWNWGLHEKFVTVHRNVRLIMCIG